MNKESKTAQIAPQYIKIEANDWRKVMIKIVELDKRVTDLEASVFNKKEE